MAMAKKSKKNRQDKEEALVKIDIYYLPKELADMYRVLRETIAEEVVEWMNSHFKDVQRVPDEELGESIQGKDSTQEKVTYFLSPTNISQAQKARDKDQLATYLEKHFNI